MQLRLALPSLAFPNQAGQCSNINAEWFANWTCSSNPKCSIGKSLQLLANTHLTFFTFNLSFVCFHFLPTHRKEKTHTSGKHHQTLHQHRLKVPQGQCIPLCPDLTGKTWWKAWIVTDLHHLCSAVDTWPRELFQLEFTRIPRTKNLATHMTHITARNVLRHPSRLVSGWLKTNSNTKTWWKLLGLGKANKSWAWLRLSFWGI